MNESHGYVGGVGGLRLFYRAWEVREPRAVVLVAHGLGEHSGRYAHVARGLNDAGFSAYALDMRGHGRSQGRRGHVRAFEHLLQDLDRLRRRACPGSGECAVFLLGHSLGGLVAMRYLQAYACAGAKGAVLVAPFVQLAMPVPGWKLKVGRLADRVAPALTLDSGIPTESVFRDEAARAEYRADPLVHRRVSARMWSEMGREAARVEAEEPIGVPVLCQLPGSDFVVDAGAAEGTVRRVCREVEVRRYPEAYHALYHDPDGVQSLSDAAYWLCEQVTAAAA